MAVTTVNAFNDMMEQFLNELNMTFPENKSVVKFQASFELLKNTTPRKVLDNFMDAITPYMKKIMARDETFITEDTSNIPTISEIDLNTIWSQASDQTKGAIWQYLHTLVILGTTIKSFPSDTLSMIEELAQKCAGQMEDSSLSLLNLMNTISQQK
jgi:hypothetical protein